LLMCFATNIEVLVLNFTISTVMSYFVIKKCIPILILVGILLFSFGCQNRNTPKQDSQIFPPENFSVIKAVSKDGRLFIGSMNMSYKNYALKNKYPWCLMLSLVFDTTRLVKNNMPDSEDISIAYTQEDSLVYHIKKITTAHYIGHLFNDGFLDIYCYLDDPEQVHAFLQSTANDTKWKLPFSWEINNDPNWDRVKQFMAK